MSSDEQSTTMTNIADLFTKIPRSSRKSKAKEAAATNAEEDKEGKVKEKEEEEKPSQEKPTTAMKKRKKEEPTSDVAESSVPNKIPNAPIAQKEKPPIRQSAPSKDIVSSNNAVLKSNESKAHTPAVSQTIKNSENLNKETAIQSLSIPEEEDEENEKEEEELPQETQDEAANDYPISTITIAGKKKKTKAKASKAFSLPFEANSSTTLLKKKKKITKTKREAGQTDNDSDDEDEDQEARNLALLETRKLFHQQLEQLQEMITQHQSTISQLKTKSTSLEKEYLQQQKQMLTALQHQTIDRQLIQSLVQDREMVSHSLDRMTELYQESNQQEVQQLRQQIQQIQMQQLLQQQQQLLFSPQQTMPAGLTTQQILSLLPQQQQRLLRPAQAIATSAANGPMKTTDRSSQQDIFGHFSLLMKYFFQFRTRALHRLVEQSRRMTTPTPIPPTSTQTQNTSKEQEKRKERMKTQREEYFLSSLQELHQYSQRQLHASTTSPAPHREEKEIAGKEKEEDPLTLISDEELQSSLSELLGLPLPFLLLNLHYYSR